MQNYIGIICKTVGEDAYVPKTMALGPHMSLFYATKYLRKIIGENMAVLSVYAM